MTDQDEELVQPGAHAPRAAHDQDPAAALGAQRHAHAVLSLHRAAENGVEDRLHRFARHAAALSVLPRAGEYAILDVADHDRHAGGGLALPHLRGEVEPAAHELEERAIDLRDCLAQSCSRAGRRSLHASAPHRGRYLGGIGRPGPSWVQIAFAIHHRWPSQNNSIELIPRAMIGPFSSCRDS